MQSATDDSGPSRSGKQKKTRRRLRVSCVECTRRRQVRHRLTFSRLFFFLFLFCLFQSLIFAHRSMNRNVIDNNHVVSAEAVVLNICVAGSSNLSLVQRQHAPRRQLNRQRDTALLPSNRVILRAPRQARIAATQEYPQNWLPILLRLLPMGLFRLHQLPAGPSTTMLKRQL